MRLAVIADVHGNVLALEAVLADIGRRGADSIVNLGDCLSGPLWPQETWERLRALHLPTARGNHDRWLANKPRAEMGPSDAFAFDHTSNDARAWAGRLSPRIELPGAIFACHGTPADDNAYLLETVSDGRLVLAEAPDIDARLGTLDARIVLCGHSHQPRIARGRRGVLMVNPGSVGLPAYADDKPPHRSETGTPHARYALVTGAPTAPTVELIAVAYDWDAAAKRATENSRLDWARALARGYMG
jgi:predicted phosphodiesterase